MDSAGSKPPTSSSSGRPPTLCHCQQPRPHLQPNNSLPSPRRRHHRPNTLPHRRAFSSSEAANQIFIVTFAFAFAFTSTFTFTTEFASPTTRQKKTHRESSAVPVAAATRGPRRVEGVHYGRPGCTAYGIADSLRRQAPVFQTLPAPAPCFLGSVAFTCMQGASRRFHLGSGPSEPRARRLVRYQGPVGPCMSARGLLGLPAGAVTHRQTDPDFVDSSCSGASQPRVSCIAAAAAGFPHLIDRLGSSAASPGLLPFAGLLGPVFPCGFSVLHRHISNMVY